MNIRNNYLLFRNSARPACDWNSEHCIGSNTWDVCQYSGYWNEIRSGTVLGEGMEATVPALRWMFKWHAFRWNLRRWLLLEPLYHPFLKFFRFELRYLGIQGPSTHNANVGPSETFVLPPRECVPVGWRGRRLLHANTRFHVIVAA
jgi:hypothetical protein